MADARQKHEGGDAGEERLGTGEGGDRLRTGGADREEPAAGGGDSDRSGEREDAGGEVDPRAEQFARAAEPTDRPPRRATRAAAAARRQGRPRASRHEGAVERVSSTDFPIVLRGYDRQAVDNYVAEVSQLVAELEGSQAPETVVQRALDEVGQQTSGILQQARKAAEDIASRARAQAEERIQRAQRDAEVIQREADERVKRAHREADTIRREAEKSAEAVLQDATRIWQDRQRLVQEMRRLAEEVLGVADHALDRLKEPPRPGRRVELTGAEQGAAGEPGSAEEATVVAPEDERAPSGDEQQPS